MSSVLLIIIAALIILLVIGIPVGFTFAAAGIIGGWLAKFNLGTISSTAYYGIYSFALLAIPLFILAGELMNRGKLVDRLVNLAEMLFFWLKGRLGHVCIVASAFLGAMTGSSVATVAAISSSLGGKMVQKGYKRGYVAAVCASSGLLGVLIPPAIPLIVYGAACSVSVADLFKATIVPGIVMTVSYMLLHAFMLPKILDKNTPDGAAEGTIAKPAESFRDASAVLLKSIPALIMPLIILGGIYSGLFTATEAAAIAGFYTLMIIIIMRLVDLKGLAAAFMTSAKTSAAIMTIIGFTSVFNKILTLMQMPQKIAAFTVSITDNKILFLLFVNILLFLVGMFMETNAAVLLMAPLLYPSAVALGVDPVHFGIILVTNIEIGLITPPMSANIYVSARANKSSLAEMWPYQWKYLVVSIAVLMIITYVPALSLWWE
ncbi:MAG: TRAP transporter large permease [Oscillospiraceae bacterium]